LNLSFLHSITVVPYCVAAHRPHIPAGRPESAIHLFSQANIKLHLICEKGNGSSSGTALAAHKSMSVVHFSRFRILANRTLGCIDSHPGFQFPSWLT
jgi:hypothetical protein